MSLTTAQKEHSRGPRGWAAPTCSHESAGNPYEKELPVRRRSQGRPEHGYRELARDPCRRSHRRDRDDVEHRLRPVSKRQSPVTGSQSGSPAARRVRKFSRRETCLAPDRLWTPMRRRNPQRRSSEDVIFARGTRSKSETAAGIRMFAGLFRRSRRSKGVGHPSKRAHFSHRA